MGIDVFHAAPPRSGVTVLMATYQGERYVAEQVLSLAQQSRPPRTLLVQDDGSTDSTVAEIERLQSRLPFELEIHRGENVGWIRNFERGLQRVDTEFVAFCDQDDVWLPDKLARQLALFERDHELDLVFGNAIVVDSDLRRRGTTLPPSELTAFRRDPVAALLRYNLAQGSTIMMRTRLREPLLPAEPGWSFDAWIALAAAVTGVVAAVDAPVLLYRQHSANVLGTSVGNPRRYLQLLARIRGESQAQVCASLERYLRARARLGSVATARTSALAAIDRKIGYLQRRVALPERRVGRLRPIVQELATGGYGAYGRGVWSAFRDLLA